MIGLGIALLVIALFLTFAGIQLVRAKLWSSWHQDFSHKMGIVVLILGGIALVAGIVVIVTSSAD
jgi:hypothetical protein